MVVPITEFLYRLAENPEQGAKKLASLKTTVLDKKVAAKSVWGEKAQQF